MGVMGLLCRHSNQRFSEILRKGLDYSWSNIELFIWNEEAKAEQKQANKQ